MRPQLRKLVDLNRRPESLGMTLVEVVIAMSFLVVFGAIFVSTMSFLVRFFGEVDGQVASSQGLFVDHYKLQVSMDQITDVLSQPGLSLDDLQRIEKKGCAYDPMAGSLDSDEGGWGLPGKSPDSPQHYKFCLFSTPLAESSIESLINSASKPGIYVIQAVPDELSIAALPVRRIFCRPRPFC